MVQFARGDQDSIKQLLDLGVMSLRLVEYLADEVYWLLDLVHMPNLLASTTVAVPTTRLVAAM
jgi:hypothetical protein